MSTRVPGSSVPLITGAESGCNLQEAWVPKCSVCSLVDKYLYVLWGFVAGGVAILCYYGLAAVLRRSSGAPTHPVSPYPHSTSAFRSRYTILLYLMLCIVSCHANAPSFCPPHFLLGALLFPSSRT